MTVGPGMVVKMIRACGPWLICADPRSCSYTWQLITVALGSYAIWTIITIDSISCRQHHRFLVTYFYGAVSFVVGHPVMWITIRANGTPGHQISVILATSGG